MSNLISVAASMMNGGDDLTVVRDDYQTIIDVRLHHNDQSSEYLRGMVELICESIGILDGDGRGRSVVYQAILDRTDVKVFDI